MAEPLKPNGSDSAINDPQHNVGNLHKLIRECASDMVEIKEARKDLNERAGEIRQRLKEAGVQTKAFDFAVRLREMEQEARDDYLDSLRVNFEALSIGQQGEMFAVAEARAQPSA